MAAQPVIPGAMLDYYLSQGYYRMNQDLFTCRFLPMDSAVHTVHWLRLAVPRVQYGPKQRHLLRRNAHFTLTIQPLELTDEHEALYARYHQALAFDTAPTLEALLLDGATHSVFTSYIMEVRDAGQLIAAGIFDQGQDSIAGIVNFYDPSYRHYSLGKYLLLCKTEHARRQQLAYYYPGYLVHGYPKFDYKLFACEAATEVFDCLNSEWLPFSWPEVARQSAALVAEQYLRSVFGDQGE